MRVLFVYPNITRQTTPQMGIASLMAVVGKKHQVALFDLTNVPVGKELHAFADSIERVKPDVILISCRTNEWGLVKKYLEIAYPITTVLGGVHPTVVPEEVIKHAKILVRGEGEGAVDELLENLQSGKDITGVANIWTKQRGRIYRNAPRPLIQELDKLPFQEWRAFDKVHFYKSYITSLFPDIVCVGTFETTRGCPYSCTYCVNAYLQDLYKGQCYHRKKSAPRVAAEIANFKALYPDCNFIYFVDDTFLVGDGWMEQFAKVYDKTPFVFMTRAEMVTESKIKIAAKLGARAVSIGVENGNEAFRKKVLNRHMPQKKIIDAFRICKDYGLRTYSFNMVGLPYETKRDILSTIELNKKLDPDIAQFTVFFPFKGTKLYDICVKEGYLEGDYPETFNYYNKSFLNLPNLSKEEISSWAKKAEKIFSKKKK